MQAWEAFLQTQEKELGKEIVSQWLRPLKILHFDAANLYLEAKDTLLVHWFEEHMRPKVRARLLNNNHRPIKIHLTLMTDGVTPGASKGKHRNKVVAPTTLSLQPDAVDPSATFDHFVEGTNALLLQLLQGVGEQLSFNPIYMYGSPGIGKTHLLMATHHKLQQQKIPSLYVRAETFTEHVVRSMRIGAMQEFRKHYRNVSVLLIDDINVFARRSATQEEFFHTFNALHTTGRQIVLSAQVSPAHLLEIEPRLVSRFEWGLTLPIEKLDTTGQQHLLLRRCQSLGVKLTEDCLQFLNETFSDNPHSLCRALDALVMRAGIGTKLHSGFALTVKEIGRLLADLIRLEQEGALTCEKIIRSVSDYYGVRVDDILGKAQTQEYTFPRQIAMFLCRQKLRMPYLHIATAFSRDHSTVMASVKQIQKRIEAKDKETCAALSEIARSL